jgi:glutathione synthase/RimK-type ligase-like ATP-grasp enzyme
MENANLSIIHTTDQSKNSAQLLQNSDIARYLESLDTTPFIQTFKTTSAFEYFRKQYKHVSLNTTSVINKRFERKLGQTELFRKFNIPHPPTIITTTNNMKSSSIYNELKTDKYVIQFDIGHTGEGTYFIREKGELDKVAETYSNKRVRITKFIDGETWTINAVATKVGTFIGGISNQITGESEYTAYEGSTIGNDWAKASELSEKLVNSITSTTELVGEILYRNGFQGLFGIDFIIKDTTLYVIEINARQPASISFETQLQEIEEITPLKVFHLAEFLSDNERDFTMFVNDFNAYVGWETMKISDYNNKNAILFKAMQKIRRNVSTENIVIQDTKEIGIYSELGFITNAYSIKSAKENEYIYIQKAHGQIVKPNEEISRKQYLNIKSYQSLQV